MPARCRSTSSTSQFQCDDLVVEIHASASNNLLSPRSFNLETVVGRGEVCGYGGAGQGAARRNGCSIPTSCNAARHPQNRAIRPVAAPLQTVERKIYQAFN